jgi:cell division septation protein DedD
LFVAVLLGAGLLLFYPRDDQESVQTASADRGASGEEFDPIEYLRESEQEGPDFESKDTESGSGDVVIVYGQKESETATADGQEDSETADSGDGAATGEDRESVDRASDEAAETESGQAQEDRQADRSAAEKRAEERVASAREEAAAQRESRQAAERKRAQDAAAAERQRSRPSQGETGTNYWIQVISSPNLGVVRDAQATLDERNLGSRITTKSVDGTNYFRLRVGPYSKRKEAEKFLGWVQRIEGFKESYISETYFRM